MQRRRVLSDVLVLDLDNSRLRGPLDGAQGLAFLSGYLARIGAVLALQVEMLADGVFKQSHGEARLPGDDSGARLQAYSAARGSRGDFSARTVRFLPVRLAW